MLYKLLQRSENSVRITQTLHFPSLQIPMKAHWDIFQRYKQRRRCIAKPRAPHVLSKLTRNQDFKAARRSFPLARMSERGRELRPAP